MKTSLVNLIFRALCDVSEQTTHRKGIAARILMDGVNVVGKMENRTRIVVPWPLPPMIPILKSFGYTEHNDRSGTREMAFLRELTATSTYYTLDL